MIFNKLKLERSFAKRYGLSFDQAARILIDIKFYVEDYKRRSMIERRKPIKLVKKAILEDHQLELSRFAVMRWYKRYKNAHLE